MIGKRSFLILVLSLFSFVGFAQQNNNLAKIQGVVLDGSLPGVVPVAYATVQLSPQNLYAITSDQGNFEIANIEPGQTNLKVQFIGMQDIDTTFNIVSGKVYQLTFRMTETSFRLEEVTVSATQSKAGAATASNISRQAMDHLQTSSIGDVMQLLPGAAMVNSDLSSANNFTIRAVGGSSSQDDGAKMNSLGTSIIIDGAPMSNNANLQALAPSITGSGAPIGGGSSAESGVDLRGISTDNIESLEVIRGIASVEYGDMTSGVVAVKSKVGAEPLSVRFKTNPYTYQAAVSKGLKLGKKAGTLNLSGDYAYNSTKQTEAYAYYQRVNLKGVWFKTFDHFNMNTTATFNYRKDSRDLNPDDLRTQLRNGAREVGFRITNNGTWSPSNASWFKSLSYSFAFSYANKHSFEEKLLENAFAPYSMSVIDGSVISNVAGADVFDKEGNKITNFDSSEKGFYTTYLPNAYFSRYDIYGEELNAFAKLIAKFSHRWDNISNNILLGLEFKTDGNLGKGIVYDMDTPPLRNTSVENSSYRPRKFSDIPFLNQFSAYAEYTYLHNIADKREFKVVAGVRYDQYNNKAAVTPRVNASFEIIPKRFYLRGGYGINAKAPTALYLYPQDAYFDFVNFNNLGSATVPENEQLMLTTTRVFDASNSNLKIAKNRKAEVGFNAHFNKGKIKLFVTAYHEKLKDGYSLGRDASSFNLVPYKTYKIAEQTPGGLPTLELLQEYNVWARVAKPGNNLQTVNKGIEWELDLGRVNSIRTSFYINGAWQYSSYKDTDCVYSSIENGTELEYNIGIKKAGLYNYGKEKINTRFMITHNIPKIGFVISLTANVDWKNKSWKSCEMAPDGTYYDELLLGYISYKDGKTHMFDTPIKKGDKPEYDYMFSSLSDTRFVAESYQPTLIFNFQISKEIGKFLTASFYVNNLFNSRPLYERKGTPGSYVELGNNQFFGFDLKINIR